MPPVDISNLVKIVMLLAKYRVDITKIIGLIIVLINAIRADVALAAPAGTFSTPHAQVRITPVALRAVAKAAKAGKRAEVKKLLTAALEG